MKTIINYFIDYTEKTDLYLFYTFVDSFVNNTIDFTAIVLKTNQALVKVLSTEFGTC